MKSKLIVVEGPQGVGKTTITDHIRNVLPYTNLLRLSGFNDNSKKTLPKVVKNYKGMFSYLKSIQNSGINILFDRFFFTEEVYCRLGFKEYSFTRYYNKFLKQLVDLDFDKYYINLYVSNIENYKERLKRQGKAKVDYALFSKESSEKQQKMYLKIADELFAKCWPDITIKNVSTDEGTIEQNQKLIEEVLNIK